MPVRPEVRRDVSRRAVAFEGDGSPDRPVHGPPTARDERMTQSPRIYHPPEEVVRLPRRRFLGTLLGGAAAATLPGSLDATLAGTGWSPFNPGRPTARASVDEAFWALVRDQFPLRPGLTLMNAANLCPAPYPVIDAVNEWTRLVDADASFQNRGRFRDLRRDAEAALARYVGAEPGEVVITRNTTEGNNIVVGGVDLGHGDEVVLWDQNHPSNSGSWDVGARRHGYDVIRVTTPAEPLDAAALVAPFEAALTSRTRVLAFSHHSNVSGVALPAAQLCRLARDRGILTHVDGAQTFGWLNLELRAMGCDFYAASAHKWFMGPKEAGIFYVRRESVEKLWPLVVGLGWERAHDEQSAARFATLGQRHDATVAAMGRAVAFHESIGAPLVEARVRELVATLRTRISDAVPGVRFHTPADAALNGGVLIFQIPGVEPRAGFQALYESHDIGSAGMSGGFPGIRLSPHIYNTLAEAERAAEAVASLA